MNTDPHFCHQGEDRGTPHLPLISSEGRSCLLLVLRSSWTTAVHFCCLFLKRKDCEKNKETLLQKYYHRSCNCQSNQRTRCLIFKWHNCLAIIPGNVERSLTFQYLEKMETVQGGNILGARSLVYGKWCSCLFVYYPHTLSLNICLAYVSIFVLYSST